MPFNVGPLEIVVVLVVALIILGPKRLPDAGRALGSGIRNFRHSLTSDNSAEGLEQSAGELTAGHRAQGVQPSPPAHESRTRTPHDANRHLSPDPSGPA